MSKCTAVELRNWICDLIGKEIQNSYNNKCDLEIIWATNLGTNEIFHVNHIINAYFRGRYNFPQNEWKRKKVGEVVRECKDTKNI